IGRNGNAEREILLSVGDGAVRGAAMRFRAGGVIRMNEHDRTIAQSETDVEPLFESCGRMALWKTHPPRGLDV
ncbi:hypothetical protein, partial [Candidatus Frankia nodulisporulans]|uniref:hypothetical protein n=1 Tax=Candidatus Frankia nodulisporulans TaxID=2060052 RepID=UPI001CDC42F7